MGEYQLLGDLGSQEAGVDGLPLSTSWVPGSTAMHDRFPASRARTNSMSSSWSQRSRAFSSVSGMRRVAMAKQAGQLVQSRETVGKEAKQQSTQSYHTDYVNDLKNAKHVQSYVRWSILWTVVFVLGLVPLPYYLIPLNCQAGTIFVMAVQAWGAAVVLYTSVKTVIAMRTLLKAARLEPGEWLAEYPRDDPRTDKLTHVVLMRGYKEPLDLMFCTVDSLRRQTVAARMIVVIGLEEGSPSHYDEAFYDEYNGAFKEIIVTRHPRGWSPGEQIGACSNSNYAWRQIVQKLVDADGLDREATICTSADTDTIWPPDYFEYLGLAFLRHRKPHEVIWQAPLFYNLALDKRPFFVRCTGILRTAFMCAFLIGQDLNPMSTFSFSIDLLIRANFIHPVHAMDDVVMVIQFMKVTRRQVPVIFVPLVVVSGPTSGANLWEELYEWARQIRRWQIGTMAVFHYMVAKALKGTFRPWSIASYILRFTHYYGFVLCSMMLTGLNGSIAIAVWRSVDSSGWGYCDEQNGYSRTLVDAFSYGSLVASYLGFTVFFIMDALGKQIAGVEEQIHPIRHVLHFLAVQPVLIMVNLVQVWSSIEASVRGKTVLGHFASKKDSLAAPQARKVAVDAELAYATA